MNFMITFEMISYLSADVYIEGGSIQAKITVADIGCTNGVIHLISNVLFQKDFTIWEAVQGNSQLKYVHYVNGYMHSQIPPL